MNQNASDVETKQNQQEELRLIAKNIKCVIFDVDGVLTDGGLFFDNQGQEIKAFNSKDGHGIRMLLENGVEVAIITGRKSDLVKHPRMAHPKG